MVRQNRRKGLEEVYGTKMDAIYPAKSQNIAHSTTKTATMRAERAVNGGGVSMRNQEARTQRSYVTANDYYITTNVPLTATNLRNAPSTVASQAMQAQAVTTGNSATPYATRRGGGGAVVGAVAGGVGKASARGQVQAKSLYTRTESLPINKSKELHHGHAHNHAHSHSHSHSHNHGHNHNAKPQLSQRVIYAAGNNHNTGTGTNTGTEFSDKELLLPASGVAMLRRSHTHPLQHQLHQQQQTHHAAHGHHKHPHQHSHRPPQEQLQQQPLQHGHHKHKHQHPHPHARTAQVSHADDGGEEEEEDEDNEKDDDPEEFFELIRQTVQTAIGSTVSDVLNRNFRDLGTKIERFSSELKVTNEHLDKLQDQVTNKVVHYGEENSRHFRYLCMKSEYDKMFYQHHTMLANKQPTDGDGGSQINLNTNSNNKHATGYNVKFASKHMKQQLLSERHNKANSLNPNPSLKSSSKNELVNDCVKAQNPCACRSTSKAPHQTTEAQKSSSDQSVAVKSSELGMREVLGHIQRFCTQMQLNDMKVEQHPYNTKELLSNLEDMMSSAGNPNGANVISASVAAGNSTTKGRMAAVAASSKQELDTPGDSMDEAFTEMDDFVYSSDEMSERSDDSDLKFPSGAMTSRSPLKSAKRLSNNGAGDGQ